MRLLLISASISATDGRGAPRFGMARDHAFGPVNAVNVPESYPLCDFLLLIDPPDAFGSPCVAVEKHKDGQEQEAAAHIGVKQPGSFSGRSGVRVPGVSLTSYWNERKAHETGVLPISSGYTLGFWRGREERC